MKKIIINVFIIIFYSTSVYSQTEFAPIGAKWYYSYNYSLSSGYIKIESIGDTAIQSKSCKILEKTGIGYTWPGYYENFNLGKEYVCSDSNIVYYYRNENLYTLYNFNSSDAIWKVVGNPLRNNIDSGIVYVDSSDEELINEKLHNIIFVKSTLNSCIGWYNAKIIEGIGVVNEYMFPDYIDCIIDANEGNDFKCFFINDSLIYSISNINNECDSINNILKYSKTNISIYPNPFEYTFNVKFDDIDFINNYTIEIFDVLGKKVQFKSILYSFNIVTIEINDNYISGFLFLKIKTEKNQYFAKLLKN